MFKMCGTFDNPLTLFLGQHPRAVTPPLISRPKVDEWQDQPQHSLSLGSEAAHQRQNPRQGKILHMLPVPISQVHDRSSSGAPLSHAEAVDKCIGTAMALSPRHLLERDRDAYDDVSGSDLAERRHKYRHDEVSVSNLTELERQAEAEAEAIRHVTFRTTPSLRSINEVWEASELNSQRAKSEQDEGGWGGAGSHDGATW